jgi:two-component system sensor histidine kinase TctE
LQKFERSVSRRSPEDLTPITDAVPREVSTLVERINELFEQVSEALAGRERFISNAAHQLKNPVSGLVLMSEAALNAPDDATRRERAGGVVVAAKSLMRFSNQMLSLERARSFDKGHTLKVLDLNNVVLKACERLASMLLSQGIAINFDRSVNPIYVRGDALLLQEAVTNLVSNATNHAGTKNRAIDIRTFVSAGSAVVAVRDYGVGFPTHAIDGEGKLTFERFASLDAENGSGLGLPIVKEIVSKHTGRLDLLNRTPGAEVQLVLPVVAAPLRG